MKWRCFQIAGVPAALLAGAAVFGGLLAGCPRGDAATSASERLKSASSHLVAQFTIADFDGDRRPDLAVVEAGPDGVRDSLYWISFRLSSGVSQSLGVTAPRGGLQISSQDVNSDGFLDVVVTTLWTNRPIAVLLNDGRGNFHLSEPSSFPEAFTTSKNSCAVYSAEAGDASSCVLSVTGRSDFLCLASAGLPSNTSRFWSSRASGNSPYGAVVSFSGRAPPALSQSV